MYDVLSYSTCIQIVFNILYDVYTHNRGVHAPATKLILDRIIPISPQVIPLYLHIRNVKLKVLSVYKLSVIEHPT
jgi:hypothetical protein